MKCSNSSLVDVMLTYMLQEREAGPLTVVAATTHEDHPGRLLSLPAMQQLIQLLPGLGLQFVQRDVCTAIFNTIGVYIKV